MVRNKNRPDEANCAYCHSLVTKEDERTECAECGAAHHTDCWEENGGCAVVSCTVSAPVSATPAISLSECEGCHAELAEGQRFCRQCGASTALPASAVTAAATAEAAPEAEGCPSCGEPTTADDRFCRSCGASCAPASKGASAQPAQQQRSDSVTFGRSGIIVLLAGCAVLAGIAAGVFVLTGDSGGAKTTSTSATDTVTADPPTTPTDPPDNGALPNQSGAEMTRSIREVIRKHHQYIVDGNYQAAFATMSRRKQRRPSYETPSCQDAGCWGTTMSPLTSGLTQPVRPSVRIVRLFKNDGVAEIKVRISMPSCPTGAWEGITWARYERNHWTYDPGWKTNESQRSEYDRPGDTLDSRLFGVSCES